MSRVAAILIAASIALGLAGCGLKGPLERPTGPAPEPLLGNPKPAPAGKTRQAPRPNAPDISTDNQATPP